VGDPARRESGPEDVPAPAGHADVIEAGAAHAPLRPPAVVRGGSLRRPPAANATSEGDDVSERPVGLTRDAGWEVGASRTFPVAPDDAWEAVLSPAGVALWLGEGAAPLAAGACYETRDGTEGEVRSLRPGDRVRLTWRPAGRAESAIVQVVLRPAASGCSVRFHTERLHDAEEREKMRRHWRDVLDRLGDLLVAA
jgi:uncharacterized protein YndB with AHSA1/START domain